MNRETWKIFFSCALGAGIGALVALEVARMFWWVGPIMGGFIGYLSYEWRAVLRAIPVAYRAVSGLRSSHSAILTLRILGWKALFSANVVVNILIILGTFIGISEREKIAQKPIEAVFALFIMLPILTLLIFVLAFSVSIPDDEAPHFAKQRMLKATRKAAYCTLPPFVFFWYLPCVIWSATKGIPKAIAGIVRGIVSLARFLYRFSWKLFLLIHSEKRLICGTDAMIGAMIGYFAGNALIGAMAGGVFGLVNYKIITERWLYRKGYLSAR